MVIRPRAVGDARPSSVSELPVHARNAAPKAGASSPASGQSRLALTLLALCYGRLPKFHPCTRHYGYYCGSRIAPTVVR